MKVNDIMTTNLVTIGPENTVLDAAKIMQAHNVGVVPVCQQNGTVIGIVTDRDIVVRNIANDGDPATTKVKDMMTPDIVSATPDMDADTAAQLMAQNKIRRLPVLKNGAIVGMIAIGDLATKYRLQSEAGDALSQISQPARPENVIQ